MANPRTARALVVAALAEAALVAVVEVLNPGTVRDRDVLLTRPVPARLKLLFEVSEQKGLLAPFRKLATNLCGNSCLLLLRSQLHRGARSGDGLARYPCPR